MPTIALFGTSADPPTAGHQAILIWLSQHFDQVAVWASDNPFKPQQTPLHYRTTMLRLLIDEIDPPRRTIQLYPELSHPRALVTVERARQHWPEATFTLVIGSDLVAQLPRWYRIDALLRRVHLLVVPRQGYELSPTDRMRLQQISAAIAEISIPDVSSTTYREVGDAEMLTPAIEAYIHREHLYKCQDAPPKNPLLQPHPSRF